MHLEHFNSLKQAAIQGTKPTYSIFAIKEAAPEKFPVVVLVLKTTTIQLSSEAIPAPM